MLQEFKKLVNQTKPSIIGFENDMIKVAHHYGIDTTNEIARSTIIDAMFDLIKQHIKSDKDCDCISFHQIKKIEHALVYESILNDIDNRFYLSIISKLRGSTNSYKLLESTASWTEAIRHTKNYLLYTQNESSIKDLKYAYPKYCNTAYAAKALRELGVSIVLNDVELESCNYEPVLDILEKKIQQLGGITVINCIYFLLTQNHMYYREFNLYSVPLRLGRDPNDHHKMIPYGYLLNLASKYPTEGIVKDGKQKQILFNEIVEIAVQIAAILEVQPYNIWEIQFRHYGEFPKFIQDVALYDAIFTIPSYNIQHVLEFNKYVFNWVDKNKFQKTYGFTIEEYFTITELIAQICGQSHRSTTVYLSTLKKLSKPIPVDHIEKILKQLAHKIDSINVGYRYPNDYDKCNIDFKPIIELSPTKFIVYNISWAAMGFYEVLAGLTRQMYDVPKPIADSEIGRALENFVFHKLSEKNIIFYTGRYTNGECDVLIETSQAIILVEIKKKGLSRHSKSGKDTHLIVDLAAGLFDAQIQAGKIEILLRRQGYIELKNQNSGIIKRIELQERTIERIALSQMNYGSFQDRTFINGLLSFTIDTSLTLIESTDTEMAKKFDNIQKKGEIWDRQVNELRTLDPVFNHFPFFGCWFLNLWQFMVILEYAYDSNSFYKALKSIKNVSLGSTNFYFEFYNGFASRNKKDPQPGNN